MGCIQSAIDAINDPEAAAEKAKEKAAEKAAEKALEKAMDVAVDAAKGELEEGDPAEPAEENEKDD